MIKLWRYEILGTKCVCRYSGPEKNLMKAWREIRFSKLPWLPTGSLWSSLISPFSSLSMHSTKYYYHFSLWKGFLIFITLFKLRNLAKSMIFKVLNPSTTKKNPAFSSWSSVEQLFVIVVSRRLEIIYVKSESASVRLNLVLCIKYSTVVLFHEPRFPIFNP